MNSRYREEDRGRFDANLIDRRFADDSQAMLQTRYLASVGREILTTSNLRR